MERNYGAIQIKKSNFFFSLWKKGGIDGIHLDGYGETALHPSRRQAAFWGVSREGMASVGFVKTLPNSLILLVL